MKKKYSVTVFWLTAIYSRKLSKYVYRWKRVDKFYFSTKQEALSYASRNTLHYVKVSLRKEG